ncbi:MAG: 2-hydroxychromene-2-carboxylate isomerase [Alphaproteobacteria bacterium]
MTRAPILFYFDFSSPYGYLASLEIDTLAGRHGRSAAWRPILLGVVMRTTGMRPLTEVPLKGDYMRRDAPRSARRMGAPFVWPAAFPISTVAPSRAYYWLLDADEAKAKALGRALFRAYFGEGRDISQAEVTADVAATLGLGRGEVLAALQEQRIKDRLRAETEAAVAAGVFGSPYVIVDGEPFWGHDRLGDVERWLETGGW